MADDPVKQAEADNKKADKKYTIGGNVYTVDQETTNQLVLDEAAAAQTRINMKLAADEDKGLKTYFTTEEMRAAQGASDLKKGEYEAIGKQDRLKVGVEGLERRKALETEGAEQRETATTVGAQTRLTEGTKGQQERLTQSEGLQESGRQARETQAERYVGERGLVKTTAAEARETQAERYAGERGLVGEGGKQQRETQAERYAGERGLVSSKGQEERQTQAERYAGERGLLGEGGAQQRQTQAEKYTGERGLARVGGEESRALERTRGSETRRTDMQREAFRRYKEDRDYSQARSATKV